MTFFEENSAAPAAPQRNRKRRDDEERALDQRVGARVRQLRLMRGMSQEALGDAIGCSFQAVQKYETGENRISISRLFVICSALETTPAAVIEGIMAESMNPLPFDRTMLQTAQDLARCPENLRQVFKNLVRAVAGNA